MNANEVLAYTDQLLDRFKALPNLTRDQVVAARDLAEAGTKAINALVDALEAISAAQSALPVSERPALRLLLPDGEEVEL